MEVSKRREIQTAEASKDEWRTHHKPFGPEWGSAYWGKWQTISYALYELGLTHGATILDVGMGTGWTTVFLAESGFAPTGVDIAPASVEVGRRRARRYSAQADFVTADMDVLDLDHAFDAVLVFDALHHSTRQAQVVAGVARHVAPGGWVLFGEPSWLHTLSPRARQTSRSLGWVERGIRVRKLKSDCSAAGLGSFRRFYEGTAPHAGGITSFAFQSMRLLASRFASAPQMSVWLAAQRPNASHSDHTVR